MYKTPFHIANISSVLNYISSETFIRRGSFEFTITTCTSPDSCKERFFHDLTDIQWQEFIYTSHFANKNAAIVIFIFRPIWQE